jgi:predicted RND superfamily exporter protein
MEKLSNFIRKRSLWIILAVLALSTYSATALFRIEYNDDVTIFFPENSKEVALFKSVSDRFGGLDIALVGFEMKDVFALKNLKRIRQISRQLQTLEGIGSVTSLTEMRDFEERKIGGETGSLIQDLVGELPDDMTRDELNALRDKVMSREHIVGSVVSRKGDAALIICKLERTRSYWKTTGAIKQVVSSILGDAKDVKVYYGGAPFINAYIMTGTQRDIKRLSPWVALAVLVIIFTSFRSFWAALLAVAALLLGLVITLGVMPVIGKPMDLVTTSLPMILASIGSAYGIHILARYFRILSLKKEIFRADAMRETLKEVGTPVIMAGATTMVGFASFLVMDIRPLRDFGFIMAIGVAVTMVLSIIFIGAVMNRVSLGRPGKGESGDMMGQIISGIARKIASYPKIMVILMAAVCVTSFYYLLKITTETSTASYFPKGSEPIEADDFMVNRFGGSLFLQLYVEGDIKSPLVLKEMQKLEDYVSRLDGVTDVRSVTLAVARARAAMTGVEQIPPNRDQVASLSYLVEDDPAVHMLVDKDWEAALTQVRVRGYDTRKAREVSDRIWRYIRTKLDTRILSVSLAALHGRGADAALRAQAREETAQRIRFDLERVLHRKFDPADVRASVNEVLGPGLNACTDEMKAMIGETLKRDIVDDELIYIDESMNWDDLVAGVCSQCASGKLNEEPMYRLLYDFAAPEEKDAEREAVSRLKAEGRIGAVTGFRKGVRLVLTSVEDARVKALATAILEPLTGSLAAENQARYRKLQGRVIQYLDWVSKGEVVTGKSKGIPPDTVEDSRMIKVEVTGYPFLYQKMNESVLRNQIKASSVALIIIFVLVAILFKSLFIAAISMFPAVITLGLIFGSLGFTGVPMDMGVSMVSNIVLGAAVDYPIHFFWKYREVVTQGFDRAMLETMKTTGKAIALNTIEVMAGFGLLLFAVIIPVKKSGCLISLTLFVSGAATLFLMPVFIKLWHRRIEQILTRR